jgi:hypothetical protein
MHPTCPLDKRCSYVLNDIIIDAFKETGLRNYVSNVGTSSIKVIDLLGCHSIFNKWLDGQFWAAGNY